MRKSVFVYFLAFIILTAGGCAPSATKFNVKYLPGAVADKPQDRVTLSAGINNEIERYNSRVNIANHIELCWLSSESIYLNLDGLAIYNINPVSGDVNKLSGDERINAARTISEKINIINEAKTSGVAKKVSSYLFSSFGQHYSGEIIDNKNKLRFYIKTEMQREGNSSETDCRSALLNVTLTGARGRETEVKWNFKCDWMPQSISDYKVPQILRRVQISPAGKHYLHGSILYNAGRSEPIADLLDGYSNVISVSANPDWTKLAVLRNSGNRYWVELFNLRVAE